MHYKERLCVTFVYTLHGTRGTNGHHNSGPDSPTFALSLRVVYTVLGSLCAGIQIRNMHVRAIVKLLAG